MSAPVAKVARKATVSAVVTRADGTVEDYGVLVRWHSNPVMRAVYRLRKLLGG